MNLSQTLIPLQFMKYYMLLSIYLERAMAHCGSSEVLIVGGVGCMLYCILISVS